jgi:hypothetical protein
MAYTFDEAIQQIGKPEYSGIDGLRKLVLETSAVPTNAAPDAISLIYSADIGGVKSYEIAGKISSSSIAGDTRAVVMLADTPVSQLLNSGTFYKEVVAACGGDKDKITLIFDGKDVNGARVTNSSLWDLASEQFAASATGEVRTLTPNAIENSVFFQTELPALVQSNKFTTH